MTSQTPARSFVRVCFLFSSTLLVAGLASNWLWPDLLPRAHALQSEHLSPADWHQELDAKKKKRKRKRKRRGGRRGGLGGDFEGGGGSYHAPGLLIGPEKLAAP